MPTVRPKGKMFVITEPDEVLRVQSVMGYLEMPNGRKLQVKRAWVNAPANTADTELIPAVEDAVIRIVSLHLQTGGTATEVTIKSREGAEASEAISPLYATGVNGVLVLPFNEHGWLQGLDLNEAITVTTGAGSAVGIVAQFVELPNDAFDLL